MTVAELIAELSKFDPDLPVGYGDMEYGWTEIDGVEERADSRRDYSAWPNIRLEYVPVVYLG